MILLDNLLSIENTIIGQSITGTTPIEGTGIDTSNYEGTLLIHVSSQAPSASDTLTITVEDSDVQADGSDWAAATAAALFDPATGDTDTFDVITDAAASHQTLALRLAYCKRYVRVVVTAAGSGITIPFNGAFLVGHKKYANFAQS